MIRWLTLLFTQSRVFSAAPGGVQLLGAYEWRPMSPDMKKGGPANGAMNGAMRLGKSVEPILGKNSNGAMGNPGRIGEWKGIAGLENIQKAIENGHRNSEFSYEKW